MRLMGELVKHGFLPWQEVIATRSIHVLTEHPTVSTSLLGLVESTCGTQLIDPNASPVIWMSEVAGRGQSRFDLAALVPDPDGDAGRLVAVIEAKITAPPSAGQLRAYRESLHTMHGEGERPAALCILVPETRTTAATAALEAAMEGNDTIPHGVLTWSSVLEALKAGIDDAPEDVRTGLHEDLRQLADAVNVYSGLVLTPFGPPPYDEVIRARRPDLVNLVDAASLRIDAEIAPHQRKRNPAVEGRIRLIQWGRYHQRDNEHPALHLGIPSPEDPIALEAPLVAFIHQDTPTFDVVRERLTEAPDIDNRPHERGMWIPIPIPHDATGIALVDTVVDFALNLDRTMNAQP